MPLKDTYDPLAAGRYARKIMPPGSEDEATLMSLVRDPANGAETLRHLLMIAFTAGEREVLGQNSPGWSSWY